MPNWVTTIAYMGACRKRIGGCRAILVGTEKRRVCERSTLVQVLWGYLECYSSTACTLTTRVLSAVLLYSRMHGGGRPTDHGPAAIRSIKLSPTSWRGMYSTADWRHNFIKK